MLSVGERLAIGSGVGEGFGVEAGTGDGEGFSEGVTVTAAVAEMAGEMGAVISGETEIMGEDGRKAVGVGAVAAVFWVDSVEGGAVSAPAVCAEPHPAKQIVKNKRNKTINKDFFIGATMAFIL